MFTYTFLLRLDIFVKVMPHLAQCALVGLRHPPFRFMIRGMVILTDGWFMTAILLQASG